MKLNTKGVAMGAGAVSAIAMLVLHILAVTTGTGAAYIQLVLELHPGASFSITGGVIAAFWMYVYGYIGGWIFATVYNKAIGRS